MNDEIEEITKNMFGSRVEFSISYAATLLLDFYKNGKPEPVFSVMAECGWKINFGEAKLSRDDYGSENYKKNLNKIPTSFKVSYADFDFDKINLLFKGDNGLEVSIGPPEVSSKIKEDFIVFDRQSGKNLIVKSGKFYIK